LLRIVAVAEALEGAGRQDADPMDVFIHAGRLALIAREKTSRLHR